jgi:ParB family transcriptional regulator, chromosome partitioning protein
MPRRNSLKDEWKFDLEASSTHLSVPINSISLPASQPRRYFDPQKLQQLIESIRKHGIIEPILVRLKQEEGDYELVAGERRFRAAKEIGLDTIPAIVRDLNDEESLQLALVENLLREDLNPVEEAEGILQLIGLRLNISPTEVPAFLYRMRNEVVGNSNQNVLISPEAKMIQVIFAELATITWESFVTTRMPLLNLPQEVLEALRGGQIAYTKAQLIARVKDESERMEILESSIEENLTIAQIKQRISNLGKSQESKDIAPLKTRMDQAYKQMRKSKIWTDPKTQKQLEKLVGMIETLVSKNLS